MLNIFFGAIVDEKVVELSFNKPNDYLWIYWLWKQTCFQTKHKFLLASERTNFPWLKLNMVREGATPNP